MTMCLGSRHHTKTSERKLEQWLDVSGEGKTAFPHDVKAKLVVRRCAEQLKTIEKTVPVGRQ